MSALTALGIPYPVPGDSPNVPADMLALAGWLDSYLANRAQARQVKRSITINVADSTATHIATYDLGDAYNVGSIAYGTGIMTVPVAGLYEWDLTALWPATTTAHSRQWWVEKNGAGVGSDEGHQSVFVDGSHGAALLSGGGHIALAAGDTLQATLWQSSGGTLVVSPKAFTLARVA